jgi:hypothetical protein
MWKRILVGAALGALSLIAVGQVRARLVGY